MVVQYSAGSIQPLRMDNRENEFDSGIRVTCAYHLVPVPSTSTRSCTSSSAAVDQSQKIPAAQLLYSVTGAQGKDKDKEAGPTTGPDKSESDGRQMANMKKLDVEHDQ